MESNITIKKAENPLSNNDMIGKFCVPIGIDENEDIIFKDLSDIPHMLIGGTTGSGKTSFIRSLISTLSFKYDSDKIKFIIFDSKAVDYNIFNTFPHLSAPVISSVSFASRVLSALNIEAATRLNLIAKGYGISNFPDIFLILDDCSCLSVDDESKDCLTNILKIGRAVRIHAILSTSTPSCKALSADIKSNISCRIAFATASKSDSRAILDMQGAEKLDFPGFMIYKTQKDLIKCKAVFTSDEDVQDIANKIKEVNGSPEYSELFLDEIEKSLSFAEEPEYPTDELFLPAVEIVVKARMASTTLLQQKLKIGYARAARLMDTLEGHGIIGPFEGSKPREVLITEEQFWELQHKRLE